MARSGKPLADHLPEIADIGSLDFVFEVHKSVSISHDMARNDFEKRLITGIVFKEAQQAAIAIEDDLRGEERVHLAVTEFFHATECAALSLVHSAAPHLHVHFVVTNTAKHDDGRLFWLAIDWNTLLIALTKAAFDYQARMVKAFEGCGVNNAALGSDGMCQITGISVEVEERYSKMPKTLDPLSSTEIVSLPCLHTRGVRGLILPGGENGADVARAYSAALYHGTICKPTIRGEMTRAIVP